MNLVLKITAVLAFTLLTACAKEPVSASQTNNQNVQIGELFTHKGITVYRFYDSGRPVYFTSRENEVSAPYTETCGKGCNRQETTRTLGNQ